MKLLRNLGRRKVRTTLTILGITIGIWALVVFGSMANKINALVAGGSDLLRRQDHPQRHVGAVDGFSAAPMSLTTADAVRRVEGVAVVVPAVMMLMADEASAVNMGIPPMITGSVAGADQGRETFRLDYANGRTLTAADEGSNVTVLGSDIARKYDKHVGDTITLRGEPFTVVGILEPTLTAPDQAADGPARRRPAAVRQDAAPAVAAKLDPLGHRDLDDRLPDGRATLRSRSRREIKAAGARRGHDDRQGLRPADRLGHLDPQLDPGRDRPDQPRRGRPLGRSTRWRCRSPSGRARSASSAPSAAAALRIVREFVTESALIGFIGGALGLALGARSSSRSSTRPGAARARSSSS